MKHAICQGLAHYNYRNIPIIITDETRYLPGSSALQLP